MTAALLGGCGSDDEESTVGTTQQTAPRATEEFRRPTVSVKTFDHGFEVPAQFSGELVTLELDNSAGREAHEASFVRLEQGKTLADLQQALRQGGRPPSGR